MRKRLSTLLFALISLCAGAQEIKSIKASFDDYLSLLQESGYNVFAYDISSLKDNASHVEFSVKEYVNGDLVDASNSHSCVFQLILRISEFSEEDQKEIKAMGIADDKENDIFRLATRLKIGFTPVIGDTIQEVQFEVAGKVLMGGSGKWLKLHDSRVDKSHRKLDYSTRPFKVEGFEKDKFIPLVLYAAPWWDKNYEIYRFCGETEIPSDMNSDILRLSPHYFIIGVEFR